MNLHELNLFLAEDIFIISEEREKLLFNGRLKINPNQPSLTDLSLNEPIEEFEESIYELKYEGEFQKGILIVHQGKVLASEAKDLLMKILSAVNCSLQDIALTSENSLMEALPSSIATLNPKKVLVFGKINHPLQKLKKSNYDIISEDAEYLFADPLDDYQDSKELKRKLWDSLQLLFDINKKQ